jgi:acetyl esterase/lipase
VIAEDDAAGPTPGPTPTIGPPPPFDPELAEMAELFGAAIPAEVTVASIPSLRELMTAFAPRPTDEELTRDGAFVVDERLVPGGEPGVELSALVRRPATATASTPCLFHLHGGGMVLGDHHFGLQRTLALADPLDAAIVSVDYRLAPETPHPGPVEDCYAALVWTADHAGELGIDPGRIVVTGPSAGGGLAAAVALMARDRGGPPLAAQLLVYPMLDDRNDTPSAIQMTGVGLWDRTFNRMGWQALLGDAAGGPGVSPYAAPARATDLSGLPPAFIDVGSAETFRDEDVTYATRIWQAGGDAELHVWTGGFHGFDGAVPDAAVSREAFEARLRWLRRVLGRRSVTGSGTGTGGAPAQR